MDPILQCEYKSPITSFHVDLPKQQTFLFPVCREGRTALAVANEQLSKKSFLIMCSYVF